ncbi:TatD family hydrolase [Endozoicomonas sp. SM1973]|uniref:TatD family hydrolase n=1 Tax=Spartinivicinus marinus TaxID=2994442 RepID=A0A853I7T8_9GAMM|nr:TatD family hydrolase [Spartinivicinus marinus]MCX4029153.1 TatD family hydrolase [Spartinivicinus marinus]NYZ67772.1 TatD family hydrolase [Spartinivicinus marinus]
MSEQLNLIDIGVNLTNSRFDSDREAVIERAINVGVTTLVLTGTDLAESEAALSLCQQWPEYCFSTAGVHPHYAKDFHTSQINTLKGLAKEPQIKALGEMGLDFNRNFSPRPIQEQVFIQQLELAVELKLPVFCHERDAFERQRDILKDFRDHLVDIVIHCFTGEKSSLYGYLDLDCHIGITGWVCDERRGYHLHPLLKDIPDNRLMVETDAPYLLPRSLEKKPANRRNEPCYLPEVVKTIAKHVNKPFEQMAKETTETAKAFFRL